MFSFLYIQVGKEVKTSEFDQEMPQSLTNAQWCGEEIELRHQTRTDPVGEGRGEDPEKSQKYRVS